MIGFSLVVSEVRTCVDDDGTDAIGIWVGQPPTCVPIECPPTPPISNGSMISYAPDNTRNFSLGTIATYSCMIGFSLVVSEVRTCMEDDAYGGTDAIGIWVGQPPTCTPIMCPPLTHPYGSVTYSSLGPSYPFGTQALYEMISCPEGTEKIGGDHIRNCTSDGSSTVGAWNGAAPICADQPLFLSLQGISYTTNNSNIQVTRIGTTNDTSLTCHTDSITCCRGIHNPDGNAGFGEWFFPNGTEIARNRVTGSGFYWVRNLQAVRLYRQDDIQSPVGRYCCRIPDSGGVLRTVCANLTTNTIRCPPDDSLMAPTNGSVSYSSPEEGGSYVFGTVATFSCFPGFGLSTLGTRMCKGTTMGTFSGSSPTCDAITCSVLAELVNGTIDYSRSPNSARYSYGTAAIYQCNPGYNITSVDEVRTCTGDGMRSVGEWDTTAPQCPPVDCETPPSIINGSPGIPTTTTFTGTVTYSCNDGYALFGIATSTCQANATWSRPPECRAIECRTLLAITNGVITYVPDNTSGYDLGTVATYACDPGFVLDLSLGGSEMSTCVDDMDNDAEGVFDNQAPKCVRIICQPLFHYPYGMTTYHHEIPPYSYGTRARYNVSCPPELERSGGDDERTCTDNGHSVVGVWSGTAPICAARGVFLSFQGTTYTTNNSNIVLTRIETTNDTSLTCHTDSTTCCRAVDSSSDMGTGEWLFPNGTSIVRKKRVPSDGFYYTRFHQAIRLYRNDDTRTPLGTYCCRIPDSGRVLKTMCANLIDNNIRCPSDSVMAPTNGMVSHSSPVEGGSYSYGTVATFTCSTGFSLNGTSTRTCDTEQGTFSGTTPSCITITCSALTAIGNGKIVYSSDMIKPYNYGTTAMYKCDPGYEITSGNKKRNCTGDGTTQSGDWNGTAAMCSPVSCGQVPSDTNASPGTPTRQTFGGTVTYSCNEGYALFGIATSTCQANATWSRPPECRAIECRTLLAITNGVITYVPDNTSGYDLGTVATYACNPGFVLDLSLGGFEMSTCVDDMDNDAEGVFDNQAPKCVRIICQPLFPYPYGMTTYHHEIPPYSYGTRARYNVSCPPKLERSGGDDERTCTDNGRSVVGVWSGTAPICAARGVFLSFQGTTYTTNNSNIVLTRIETTNDTSLTCHTDSTTCCRGKDKKSSSNMGTGEWLFPNETSIVRKKVTGSGFYYTRFHQAIRLYRNNDTRTPLGTYCCRIPDSGRILKTMCANLIDNNIRCPSDSVMAPTNGTVSYTSPVEGGSYSYGTVATFTCSTGFSLNGTSTRTCDTEHGTFSGTTPSCITITCSALTAIGNGKIVYSSDMIKPYDYGTTATYKCDPGYEITSGNKKRNCTGDGTTQSGDWNGTAAMCSPVSCGQVPSDTNASPGTPTRQTFGGTVTYSCNDSYTLFGNATSTCQANATWSRPPECKGIHITGIQSGEPILIGGSVTITCTTDSPADSIMLLQDDQPKAQQLSTTTLMYTIYFVTDSIHGNIFKCEALLTGRTDTSDTAFESLTLSIKVPQQPITINIRTSSPSLIIGEPYNVTCTVSKLPGLTRTPTAQWVNVTMETEQIGMPTLNKAVLIFSPLRSSDAGIYYCLGNLNTTIHSQPLSNSSNFTLIAQIPTPTVNISRYPSSSALFANHSEVTFTCQVSIHEDIDTPVNLSLTWTREVYSDEDNTTTEVIIMNSTTSTVERSWTLDSLSSNDQRVTCNGELSTSRFIQGNRGIDEHMLSVVGVFLIFNGSSFDDNTTSVPARDVRVIQCHSDKTDTFDEDQHGWTFPNSTKITNISKLAVATREGGHLALTRVGNSSLPAGEYCCKAQDVRGTSHTLCVHVNPGPTLYVLPTKPNASGNVMVGGVVAGIVVLVVALLIIGAVILIVVRARRSGKHTFSGLTFGGGRVKRKSPFTVKVDPLTPLDIPLDDHIDTLTPDTNMYVGVTTFSKEPDKKS
ncbi:sushi, von Willebrand factor type A, EGF and pentraxin domain-containing protein 1-like isoform X2 [Halichondria panicea]